MIITGIGRHDDVNAAGIVAAGFLISGFSQAIRSARCNRGPVARVRELDAEQERRQQDRSAARCSPTVVFRFTDSLIVAMLKTTIKPTSAMTIPTIISMSVKPWCAAGGGRRDARSRILPHYAARDVLMRHGLAGVRNSIVMVT
jgi:hypothetical protein